MVLVLSVLLVFILAGFVSAASDEVDNITDSGSLDVMTQGYDVAEDFVSEDTKENTLKSFNGTLNNDINNVSSNEIKLNGDYKFDNGSDDFINQNSLLSDADNTNSVLSFININNFGNSYNYKFILNLNDGWGNSVNNVNVAYNIVLGNGSVITVNELSSVPVTFTSNSPLYDLSATVYDALSDTDAASDEVYRILYLFQYLMLYRMLSHGTCPLL